MNLSLNRPVFSSLLILFLACFFPISAQDGNGAGAIPFSNVPYKVGERLTYIVSYSNFPSAAHVEVQVVSRGNYYGRDAVQLRGHVETTDLVNVALLALNNDYIAYVDPLTGLPIRSQQVVRDATTSTDSFHDFNQPAGTVAIPSKVGFAGTYDFLSAFYRARALPLANGATYNFTVRGDTEEYQVELKVVGQQVIKTNVGSFNTKVTQVRVLNNARANKFRIRIYFSDDERHVPALITANAGDGEIRAELAGSEFVTTPAPAPSPTTEVVVAPTPKPSPSETPVERPSRDENWPFGIGEQLNYQVFIGTNNTPVGLATFQVRGRSRYFDRDGLLLTVKAQTTGAAARLFVANDQIETYVDPKAFLPYRIQQNLVEGQRRRNQTLTVNQDRGSATTDKGERLDIPVGTHDYLSFFYAVRTFNVIPPRRNAISLLVDNKSKTLFVTSLKREEIQLGQQKVSAIALSLTTDDTDSDKYQLRLWLSDDRRRLPLRVTAMTQLGLVRADLVILPTTAQ
ncbi:MAG TPA: DUF3108 domain-containing protein [Pyrinomonadaceae bacterium]